MATGSGGSGGRDRELDRLDVGKADHHATVLDAAGEVVFDRAVRNEEAAIERLLEDASSATVLVIDQPGSIGTLAVALARRRGVAVAYVPGLVMRRASQLYPGEAKTDRWRLSDDLCVRSGLVVGDG